MKLQSSVFQKKNSKRGMALSTAMAICIVLAILVAALVSMASLNITTTQNAISQREAYITAKSALAFAESYYSQHDVPGKNDANGGSAVIFFKNTVVSNGGEVYVTKGAANAVSTATVDAKKASNEYKVYVDVENTGSYFDLTANCKYNDGSVYRLSKEFSFAEGSEVQPNSFNGNVTYSPKTDARYLRIHVHTSSVFGQAPYVWTYMNTVNPTAGLGKSQIVNKLSKDSRYPSDTQGLTWDGAGIKGNSSVFEGNGWYLTELVFTSEQTVNYVNAIVAKNGAERSAGVDAQSWEFFGIPVPKQAGVENGIDVYINLNRNCLRDYQNYKGDWGDWGSSGYTYHSGTDSSYHDGLTTLFENEYGANIKDFAKYSGSWYTVSTKKYFVSTMHYRKQGVYDNSAGPGGSLAFQYEGYGWWRYMSYKPDDMVKGYRFDSANLLSYNQYTGGEQVREGYVCEFSDGSVVLYNSEAEANEAFANGVNGQPGEGEKAGDYLSVYVRSSTQPVDNEVTTKISYFGTKRDDSISPVAKSGNEELEFEKLADWERRFAVIGSFNNWGRDPGDDGTQHFYEKILNYEMRHEGTEYILEIADLNPGTYPFKIIELKDTSGSIDEKKWDGQNGWAFAYPSENASGTVVSAGNGLKISFTWNGEYVSNIDAVETSTSGPINADDEFAVIGWLNNDGKSGGSRVGLSPYNESAYGGTDKMFFDEQSKCYIYRTIPTRNTVVSGETYKFKIINVTGKEDNEVIGGDGWNNSYGGDGKVDYGEGKSNDGSEVTTIKGTTASDYYYCPPTIDGAQATFVLEIVFNPETKRISVNHQATSLGNLQFYLIGDNNSWADGTHSFNKATSSVYQFESTGEVDSKGRFLYKYTTTENMEPGDREVKVISSECLKAGMTGSENDSIDYTKCWGDFGGTTDNNFGRDGSGDGYKFTLTRSSQVEFIFAYDASNNVCCPISHTEVSGEDIKYVVIKFKNAKGKDSSNNDTEFNKWDQLFLTYTRGGTIKCSEVTVSGSVINCNVPVDCESFYFSNMYMGNDSDPNFQRTKSITMKASYAGKTFLPVKQDTAEHDWWTIEPEGSGVPDATEMAEQTAQMVYVGSMQCNYYDAPIVKLLVKIVENDPDASHASNGKYVFAAYPYKGYTLKAGSGETLNFPDENVISYQGEEYYYIPNVKMWGYSFLIVESSDGNDGGYLLENHMALNSGTFGAAASNKKYLNMDNRAGGVIVSDTKYYDNSDCAINFNNYTPNWYTYKVPCASTVRISNITGVTSGTATFFSSTKKFSPSKINQYANAPLYISEDKEGYEGAGEQTLDHFYTYNPNIANVDTDEHGKVSIYFDNAGTAEERFSQVAVYAYNPLGDHDESSGLDDLQPDTTDGNPGYSYYKYSFDAGKYCYFIFYDPTTGDHETATKKTERLYLTGTEETVLVGGQWVNTHKCDILAIGNGADRFVPYIHPKTEAMYAFNTLDAAWRGCQIPSSYTYNGSSKTYKVNGYLDMALLKEKRDSAKTYYEGSGPWTSSSSADYSDLAKKIQQFVTAIVNARTYIAEDVSTVTGDNYTGSKVFKEGSYRDDTFSYQERWVNALEAAYNNALTVYNGRNSNQVNISSLDSYIQQITSLIESPILDWNPNSVQIIVDDQVVKIGEDADGNPEYGGGWGKANIHLYNCKDNGVDWTNAGFDLFDTTQSNEGFYAYAFKLDKLPSPNYMIAKTKPEENDRNYKTMANGKRYIFHTATGKFEVDDSIMTYKVTYDKIDESDPTTTSYSWFTVRDEEDKFFAVQFLYDTTVKYSGGNYKIYAGVYNITGTYPGFNSDIAGTRGINLFTDTAKTYFSDPKTYGMSNAGSTSYSDWSENFGGTNNIDIMASSISKIPTVSARTSDTRKISFRYKNTKNNDLELKQKVELEGGTVSIAVNKIDLKNYDFIIKAKTVVFLTDTTIVTKNNGTVVVRHGTYTFNKTETEDRYTVSLQTTGENPDWREHFTLVSGTSSTLRRGRYITHE